MKSHNPKAIADKFYGDPFSRKIREGKRCCLFGPSIFKSGYGGAQLLIDKETLIRYEIYSGMMQYGDLPFLDYENQLGLFTWPSEGGKPIADDEKIKEQKALEEKSNGANSEPKIETANVAANAAAKVLDEPGNLEAEQLLFDAADAEDAKNHKLAEELYRQAITVLLKDEAHISRDSFLMLAYSALGHLLVAQKQFLPATEPLASSVAFFQASQYKQELMLSATVCVQLLGECLTELGRTDELAALATVMDEARK
jgi:hypothetical protein